MEQRIDPSVQLQATAGTDPACIPGLIPPAPPEAGEAGEAAPERTEKEEPDGTGPGGAAPEEGPGGDTAGPAGAGPEEAEAAAELAEAAEGPAFEARDRRGSITADREGVRFRLDDQEADFRWDELSAVEVKPARFGRRFSVTAYLSSNRWFDNDVEAENRDRLKEWTAEFDAVLDAYFQES